MAMDNFDVENLEKDIQILREINNSNPALYNQSTELESIERHFEYLKELDMEAFGIKNLDINEFDTKGFDTKFEHHEFDIVPLNDEKIQNIRELIDIGDRKPDDNLIIEMYNHLNRNKTTVLGICGGVILGASTGIFIGIIPSIVCSSLFGTLGGVSSFYFFKK